MKAVTSLPTCFAKWKARQASGLSDLDFRVGRTILSGTMADGQDCPSYRQLANLDLTDH
jgi:hypothetical protein